MVNGETVRLSTSSFFVKGDSDKGSLYNYASISFRKSYKKGVDSDI